MPTGFAQVIAKRKAEELPVATKKAKLGNTAKKADTKGATEAQTKGCLSFSRVPQTRIQSACALMHAH